MSSGKSAASQASSENVNIITVTFKISISPAQTLSPQISLLAVGRVNKSTIRVYLEIQSKSTVVMEAVRLQYKVV